jgi:Na+/melibiose symporter-like transporter
MGELLGLVAVLFLVARVIDVIQELRTTETAEEWNRRYFGQIEQGKR